MAIRFRPRLFLLSAMLVGFVSTNSSGTFPAYAQTTTDKMSCSQARTAYERNKRVYVRTRNGQVLPVYGGVPASQKGRLRCGLDTSRAGRMVKTTDKRRCAVMYTCQH